MGQSIVQVDAFTRKPYAGNPAAVCIMDGPADNEWMQHVAREMNLSETAFLYPDNDIYRLRWFTPTVEVDLCGHATLASAHVLYTDGHVPPEQTIHFMTRSGELRVNRDGDRLQLDFPATPPKECEPVEGLAAAMNVRPRYVGKTRFDFLIEVDSPDDVRTCAPDFGRLRQIGIRGVILTAADGARYDFISRFFAPGAGIDEDPVTGSAHCALAPYWADRLTRNQLHAFQASQRGGELWLRTEGDRVKIAGYAITVMRGELV